MRLANVLLVILVVSACGGAQATKAPYEPDMSSWVDTYSGPEPVNRLDRELRLLAVPQDEHTRERAPSLTPKARLQVEAMVRVDVERAIAEMTAKAAADPFSNVGSLARITVDTARRAAVAYAPDRVAAIDELIERAAKIHDERAAAVGEGRPVAYRFHIARAMLIRRAGSLPSARGLVAPMVALRVTAESTTCPSFAAALAKTMSSTHESKRTIDVKITVDRCNVRFSERKREEALTWDEKVDGGQESVIRRSRELCPIGRDETNTAWCRVTETGTKEVCPPQAYTRCYTQPLETEERAVVKTVSRSETRTKVETYSTIELGGRWSASFAGKAAKGTFAEPHANWGPIFTNAPALGTHAALTQPVLSADEILATQGVPEVQRVVGTAALALSEADIQVDAKSSNPDDVEEAELRRILGGAEPSPEIMKRYGVTGAWGDWPVTNNFFEIRDGKYIFAR